MTRSQGDMVYVYQVFCHDPQVSTETYIGSTKNLYARRAVHSHCARGKAGEIPSNVWLYSHISDHGGPDAWAMRLLDKRVCASVIEARAFEQEWISRLGPGLNQRAAADPCSTVKIREYQNRYYKHRKAYMDRPLYSNVKNLLMHRERFAPCTLAILTTIPRLRRLYATA